MAVAQLVYFGCFYCSFLFINNVCSEETNQSVFLNHLIREYGTNGSISHKGLERLCKKLGLDGSVLQSSSCFIPPSVSLVLSEVSNSSRESGERGAENELDQFTPPSSSLRNCTPLQNLLHLFGASGQNETINTTTFLNVCPAIIYELDQRTHSQKDVHVHEAALTWETWAYAIGMIVIVSVTGMLCVCLIPILQKTVFSKLMKFLVPLAVATLLGDAFIHLIPHALDNHGGGGHDHTTTIWKSGFIFITVVVCYTLEGILQINKDKKGEMKCQEQSHYLAVDINNCQKEMIEMVNTNSSHGHSHTSSNMVPMILIGDMMHNLMDGLAIGVAFAGGKAAGFATSLAILVHELPHELGDSAVLLEAGMAIERVMLYNMIMSLISLLGAIVGLLMGNLDHAVPWIYCATAGSFVYIALANLVPELNREQSNWMLLVIRIFGFLLGGSIMCLIALFEHTIQDILHNT